MILTDVNIAQTHPRHPLQQSFEPGVVLVDEVEGCNWQSGNSVVRTFIEPISLLVLHSDTTRYKSKHPILRQERFVFER